MLSWLKQQNIWTPSHSTVHQTCPPTFGVEYMRILASKQTICNARKVTDSNCFDVFQFVGTFGPRLRSFHEGMHCFDCCLRKSIYTGCFDTGEWVFWVEIERNHQEKSESGVTASISNTAGASTSASASTSKQGGETGASASKQQGEEKKEEGVGWIGSLLEGHVHHPTSSICIK